MYSGHPVYNGHLAISQGWPLYIGLTVYYIKQDAVEAFTWASLY